MDLGVCLCCRDLAEDLIESDFKTEARRQLVSLFFTAFVRENRVGVVNSPMTEESPGDR